MTLEEVQKLIRELRADECRCGASKNYGATFCKRCYYRLPRSLRARLYQRVGQGYEQAHAEALAILFPEEDPER